jgi:GT2 family glycosyltransferase
MKTKEVCICLLTYNNFYDTQECLQSIKRLQDNSHKTIVIDNGSTDNSVEDLIKLFPDETFIKLNENIGVPAGYNKGIIWAIKNGFDYIFILNNDTILAPDILIKLLQFHKSHKNCGIVMPKILKYPQKNKSYNRKDVWSDGGYFRKFPPGIVQKDTRKNINFDKPRLIEFAPACGLLIPRGTFEKVGLFDPGYFFFYEDWDFSIRVRGSGLTIWNVPNAKLWHKVSKSTMRNKGTYWETMGKSTIRFFSHHYSFFSSLIQISYRIIRDFFMKGNIFYLSSFLKGMKSEWESKTDYYHEIIDQTELNCPLKNGEINEIF